MDHIYGPKTQSCSHPDCKSIVFSNDVVNDLWNDDEPELSKRVAELELRVEEMWERMRQYEAVMSTAFRLHAENDLKRYE